ncbi:oxysterol binding protein 1 [Mytilinidion resinicola]|uniref:Oxysterol binding protein 1 n=1 Tax=Mytilinidion resinicola TaxID=574789 RepID=A0A6A6Z543_9PEZI|nr:oxysterol binding protein 1 [Mytilinidion resinicola]KAF2815783.1 oxysterol binding protein 1 [Mytilinidion resinicola]
MDGHKRSKSASVKHLLSRVSSKPDVTDLPENSTSHTSAAASTTSLSSQQSSLPVRGPSSHIRHPSRPGHRPHLSTTMSNAGGLSDSLAPASPSHGTSPASPTTKGTSIEQSVKMFRVFEALRNGDTGAISKAMREQAVPAADPDKSASSIALSSTGRLEGTSILHLAIQCAEMPVIEFVLSNSTPGSDGPIDINGRDKDGNTPLHLAATLGRAPVVRTLLDQPGINDSVSNYLGQTPLDLARTPEIFQLLQLARSIFVDTNVKKIQSLVAAGDLTALEKLFQDPRIRSTIDVNGGELTTDPVTLESGGTLLHEAARRRDIKLIQMLLLNGADPFRRDRKGKLPQEVTKDDRTRAILKRSPAAHAAQRGIQEKTILGSSAAQAGSSGAENPLGSKDGREMKGYLKKWTNYTSGYKLRWFVLEDGVLSYYKHQDDAGSACRGAINMKIAKLYMDPQDKQRFEIHGKSSVKYHLKANHQVEAKRWYWALNNAIRWSKDEAQEEEKRQTREVEALKQAKIEQFEKRPAGEGDSLSIHSRAAPKSFAPSAGSLSVPFAIGSTSRTGASTVDDDDYPPSNYELSYSGGDLAKLQSHLGTATAEGEDDDDDDYGDGSSSHEVQPASKDAFNITAQSAKLQLDLLGQVSAALVAERTRNPTMQISDPTAVQALTSYESAVGNLKALVGDLLRIARDRDAYWQYRLDREANVRRMWEESMARVVQEQEELESRIGLSELKRRKTKAALREALEGYEMNESRPLSRDGEKDEFAEAEETPTREPEDFLRPRGTNRGASSAVRRKSTFVDLGELSDSDADSDEFFDAVDAGEIEVVEMPISSPGIGAIEMPPSTEELFDDKMAQISTAWRGYEDGPRQKLAMDADDRPKISLWGILKSMIGKDMTKMTLPVSFNEPTSLLQRVAEDMEYTDLLDTAAERMDSTERLVYVAAFAASEYASTIARVAKPFNPLLGETYEYARPDKGYRFFIEQVSHHPPVGAAYAESKKWDYYGESAVKSKFYGKSFDINPLGTWFLNLRPTSGGSELYTWKKVTSSVVGIITGNPTVDNYGLMEVKNWNTGEVCQLDFKARGWKASSAYQVHGKVMTADGKPRWSIGGRWNDKIYARLTPGYEDSVVHPNTSGLKPAEENKAFLVWECHGRPAGIPFNLTPFCVTLNDVPDKLRPILAPTDTRLRPDQRAMEDGEYDLAASEKNRVEEKQRARRREREARGEEFVPRWFSKERCETTGEEYWAFNGEYWTTRHEVSDKGGKWEGLEDIF